MRRCATHPTPVLIEFSCVWDVCGLCAASKINARLIEMGTAYLPRTYGSPLAAMVRTEFADLPARRRCRSPLRCVHAEAYFAAWPRARGHLRQVQPRGRLVVHIVHGRPNFRVAQRQRRPHWFLRGIGQAIHCVGSRREPCVSVSP